ncbi:MAG: TonB C-terminal domain-containing protein [Synechococcaceae cyanobacterium SM2_3_1]|nr:TonB C-terminal domain-containing protein [Synechococcaceae cyanobacterium SM2_3_1]
MALNENIDLKSNLFFSVLISIGLGVQVEALGQSPLKGRNLGAGPVEQMERSYDSLQSQLEASVAEENWAEAIVIINRMMEAEPSRRAVLMDYRDRLLALLRQQSEQEKNALEAEISEEELREDRSRNVDWGPWLTKLKQRVEANWTPGQTGESRLVVLNFDVGRDGNLAELRITRRSGHPPTDNAAIAAVQKSAPFNPFPDAYPGNLVTINFQFEINVFGQMRVGGGS